MCVIHFHQILYLHPQNPTHRVRLVEVESVALPVKSILVPSITVSDVALITTPVGTGTSETLIEIDSVADPPNEFVTVTVTS